MKYLENTDRETGFVSTIQRSAYNHFASKKVSPRRMIDTWQEEKHEDDDDDDGKDWISHSIHGESDMKGMCEQGTTWFLQFNQNNAQHQNVNLITIMPIGNGISL